MVPSTWARRLLVLEVAAAFTSGLIAFVVDGAMMTASGADLRTVIGAALTAASLSILMAVLGTPALLFVLLLSEQIRRLPRPLNFAWPIVYSATALIVALLLTDVLYRPQARIYVAISVVFTLAITIMAISARLKSGAFRYSIFAAIGLIAIGIDVYMPLSLYREIHDLLGLLTIGCALLAAVRLRAQLRALPTLVLVGVLAAITAGAALEIRTVDDWAPGWRPASLAHARYQGRLARSVRALVDFDGDGYSPLAWGGDCDDFDPNRNPAHHETKKFRDANCNGIVPPEHPSDAERGLAPPAGDPDADEIDLVLLVTIDCFRKDAFRPDVVPHLWEWARHGLVFQRLYTGGSRTKLSLPLVMRGSDDGMPLPMRLKKGGIRAMALFGYEDSVLNHQVLAGFEEKYVPAHARWNATELTNLALAKIHSTVGEKRFLWIHYFDAHYPYYPPDAYPAREVPPGFPAPFGKYLANLSYIDDQFARLRDRLREDGSLGRTLIIVTADHGEGFMQHGVPLHGISAYEMLVHVLGLMQGPGIAAGEYDNLVTHRDIPATVLGAFGMVKDQPDVERFGRSWFRLRAAPNALLHRFVVTRSERAASGDQYSLPMSAIVEGNLKLIETFEDHLAELYNPVLDPMETQDLLTKLPRDAAKLDDDLQMFRDIDN